MKNNTKLLLSLLDKITILMLRKASKSCKCKITSVTSGLTTWPNHDRRIVVHIICFTRSQPPLARRRPKRTTSINLEATLCFAFPNFVSPKQYLKCPYIYKKERTKSEQRSAYLYQWSLMAYRVLLELPVNLDRRVSAERWTCSIHGENEHKTPSCFSILSAEGMANQGCGRSKKTESAKPTNSSGNPWPWMSLTPTVTKLVKPVFSKSSLK